MRTALWVLCAAALLSAAPLDENGVAFSHPDGKPLLLDLHVPDGPGPFPAAILVHGGGFDTGTRSGGNVRPLFEPLADAGFAWFSIDYRLAPEAQLPQSVADVNSAIVWVKQHSAEYRVDPRRIALIGESAGGYLVNYQGTHETPETRVAAVVDMYGPSDYAALALERRDHPERFNMKSIDGHAAHGGGIHFSGADSLDAAGLAKLRAVAPIAAVHKGMPPFLCLQGNKDDQVAYSQSLTFCAAIRKAGAQCRLVTIEGGGHGMGNWRAPEMQHWKTDMIAWLKETLR